MSLVNYPDYSGSKTFAGFGGLVQQPAVQYGLGGNYDIQQDAILRQLMSAQEKPMSGSKPIVICNGKTEEAKDMESAQAVAERLAHQHQADAYILKPVRKVAPKRDVVTTELA